MRWALWLAALGAGAILWSALCTVPGLYWNPPRLAPSYALAEGLNIYATRASGAHLGWIYGPVFALWGVPAAWVPQITWSFAVWALLNYLAIFVPAWLVLREVGGSVPAARQGLAWYALLLLANVITHSLVFVIHVDGLCVGLGTIACWSLARAAAGRGDRHVPLAALAAVLALWTKQVAVALPLALLLWLAWTKRFRLMRPLFLWLVVCGGVSTIVFFLWFGGEALLFNLWLFHVQNPLRGGWGYLGGEILRMSWTSGVWLVAAAWLVLAARLWGGRRAEDPHPLPGLLGCVALCHLPLGLAAALKAGGGLNSVHSLNYFALLLALGLMRLPQKVDRPDSLETRRWRVAPAFMSVTVVALGLGAAAYHSVRMDARLLPYRGQEKMLALAQASAGRLYFPWNPLLTLITDRKIYPFDDALFCLDRAGLAPPMAAVRAAVPPEAVLYYEEPAQSHFALNYFPGYRGSPAVAAGDKP